MGRRALPKIDPSVDFSTHLRTWEELPNPWNGEALFGRIAPLEVEVGSGKGLFLSGAAAALPEHNFLGIELAKKYARFAAARVARNGLDNVRVASADAQRVFAELLPDASLAAVHVYFPDPWWKARHHKRRMMNPRFVQQLQRTMPAGAILHFWTDVEEYFDATVALMAEQEGFSPPQAVAPRAPEHDLDYRTHFERRVRMADAPVYRAEFVRSS